MNGRFLKITDRKKEMFKTSGGKYVAPQRIEAQLLEAPLIEQVMVVGDGQKFAGALLVPNADALLHWAQSQGPLASLSLHELVAQEPVQHLFHELVQACNAQFAPWEQVKKIALLPTPWTVESGELTPTLKLKRKVITQANEPVIAGLYR